MEAFSVVDSTNTFASGWIERGAPHGAVVVADFQRSGRGRHGRSWSSLPGFNLTFSVVLRPKLPPDQIGILTIAACTGTAAAIDRFVDPLHTTIKWPNDLFLNDQKICGMLLEASWNTPGQNPAVVLGIGVNVNQVEFPPKLNGQATSLFLETGRTIPRADLFAAILGGLEAAFNRMEIDEKSMRRDYARKLMNVGEDVRLRFVASEGDVVGIVRGVDAAGGLVLETGEGRRVFHSGEVMRTSGTERARSEERGARSEE